MSGPTSSPRARAPIYRPALTRYDLQRDPVTHDVDRVLPKNVGQVHALPVASWATTRRVREPHYLDASDDGSALCGASVKVMMPGTFDPGDPDACQQCAAAVWNVSPRP